MTQKTQALEQTELKQHLATLPGWDFRDDKIYKIFKFPTYLAGINFVNVIAALAEAMNHHPDLGIGYQKVEVILTTHDAGNKVSLKDIKIAKAIEALPIFKA